MKSARITVLFTLLLSAAVMVGCDSGERSQAGAEPASYADTIYTGGPIITVATAQPTAEAVAVRDGIIVAVGSAAQTATMRGPETTVVDLAGRTLAPGFIDGHAHFVQFGLQAIGANLLAEPDGQVGNIDNLIDALKQFATGPDVSRTGWIFGTGYDDSILAEQRHPTRDDLDRVSADLPVMATHISGHFAAVNSKGLEVIGYNADTKDPPGGIIRRRPGTNEPNGVLEELAAIPIMLSEVAPKTSADANYFLERGAELAKSFGYTTAQEGRAFAQNHAMLADYANSTGFDIDVVSYIDYSDTAPLESSWYSNTYTNGYRVAGLKITLDGSPQGRTAWRTQPYLIPPDGQSPDYAGYPAFPDEQQVIDLVDTAHSNNWQILVHANGDAAIDQMLKAIGLAHDKYPVADRRHTLIHGQYIRPDQLDTMAKLGINASLFPMHTFYWGDWHEQIIGEALGQTISPTRSALNKGLPLTSHTDAPVALPNLMQVMWTAVNRSSRSGKIIGPAERLTPAEALKSITLASARQHFEEDRKGSIEVGKLADLVILSANPLTIEPERINEIIVLETIKAGASVWRRE
jgi:predicted amidohydrolase YtcJ